MCGGLHAARKLLNHAHKADTQLAQTVCSTGEKDDVVRPKDPKTVSKKVKEGGKAREAAIAASAEAAAVLPPLPVDLGNNLTLLR